MSNIVKYSLIYLALITIFFFSINKIFIFYPAPTLVADFHAIKLDDKREIRFIAFVKDNYQVTTIIPFIFKRAEQLPGQIVEIKVCAMDSYLIIDNNFRDFMRTASLDVKQLTLISNTEQPITLLTNEKITLKEIGPPSAPCYEVLKAKIREDYYIEKIKMDLEFKTDNLAKTDSFEFKAKYSTSPKTLIVGAKYYDSKAQEYRERPGE